MNWPHKDLLDVSHLSREDVDVVMRTAASFREINARPVKKVPTLKGKSVVLFFAEPSTRTKTSFDIAGKRLSADTFALAKTGSSLQKGETLKDTVLTLQAMTPSRAWRPSAESMVTSEAPLARASRQSLVEVSPSTVMLLKLRSAAAATASCHHSEPTLASQKSIPIMPGHAAGKQVTDLAVLGQAPVLHVAQR